MYFSIMLVSKAMLLFVISFGLLSICVGDNGTYSSSLYSLSKSPTQLFTLKDSVRSSLDCACVCDRLSLCRGYIFNDSNRTCYTRGGTMRTLISGPNLPSYIKSAISDFKSTKTTALSEDFVSDGVSIADNTGEAISPGDVIMFSNRYWAVYVGNKQIIRCDNKRVKKYDMDLKAWFRKFGVASLGKCIPFTNKERVARAQSQLGHIFTQGQGLFEFPIWVLTGSKLNEACKHKLVEVMRIRIKDPRAN